MNLPLVTEINPTNIYEFEELNDNQESKPNQIASKINKIQFKNSISTKHDY